MVDGGGARHPRPSRGDSTVRVCVRGHVRGEHGVVSHRAGISAPVMSSSAVSAVGL